MDEKEEKNMKADSTFSRALRKAVEELRKKTAKKKKEAKAAEEKRDS